MKNARNNAQENAQANTPSSAGHCSLGERVRAWWRGLPLMRAFACYTVACIVVAGVISFGVMVVCLEAYNYLDRIESAGRVEVDSGPYVYDEAGSELVPAVSIDLANGFGDRILFLGLRDGAGRASVEGGAEVIRADNERKVVYATMELLKSDPELEILDWGGNYTESDAREASGNPYDPEPIDPADLAAYDAHERADRVPVTDSLDGTLGRLDTMDDGTLVSNVGYYVKQADAAAESLPMLALRVTAGFAPFVVLGVCAVVAFRRFYRMRLAEPLAVLHAAADRIAAQDLDGTVGEVRGREFGTLAEAFERMRASLEQAQRELWETAEARRRLNAAFAHDLRTPVTVLKGTLEMARASRELPVGCCEETGGQEPRGGGAGEAGLRGGEDTATHGAAGVSALPAAPAATGAPAAADASAAPMVRAVDDAVLDTLTTQVNRLEAYAQAMTGITKLEDRPVHREPVEFDELCDELVGSARPVVERAGLQLHVACADERSGGVGPTCTDGASVAQAEDSVAPSGTVCGAGTLEPCEADAEPLLVDVPLVDEVLGNLVDNACRYAAGEIVLEVRVRAAGDGAALELTVADDGPGFSAEALRHGCDAFFGEAKSAEHFGLGLAIAAALVHLHGGALTLANAPIGGTRVTATFDVEVPRSGDSRDRR